MLREILARFGIRVNTAPLAAANARTTGFIKNLKLMGGLLAGGLIVRGLKNFVTKMIDLGDETAKTSRQLGLGARELASWRFAAERSGVDQARLTKGFQRLQRNIVDANQGLSTSVRTFDALGVSTEDANGNARELSAIIPELADAFGELSTDTERSARAQELFGRSGPAMLTLFEKGSEGIEKLRERFERLGIGLDQEFFDNSEAAQDSIADFELAMTGLGASIATDILPSISRFAVKTAELVADFNKATEDTAIWKTALIALGAIAAAVGLVMLIAFIKPIALILFVAAIIFVAILLVDDFLTFMEGGESLIGKFLEQAFGEGSADKVRSFINTLVDFAKVVIDGWVETASFLFKLFTEDIPSFVRAADTAIRAVMLGMIQGISNAITTVVSNLLGFIGTIEKQILGFASRVQATIDRVRSAAAGVAGFFGVEVQGLSPGGGAAPRGGTAPGVAGRGGGANADITQELNVTIDNRGGGDPLNIERRVRDAVEEANTFIIRNAQRALSTVVD